MKQKHLKLTGAASIITITGESNVTTCRSKFINTSDIQTELSNTKDMRMYKYKPVIRKILVTASHFQTKEGKMANVGPSTLPVICSKRLIFARDVI